MSFTRDDVRREHAELKPGETLLWKDACGGLSNAYSGGAANGDTTYEGATAYEGDLVVASTTYRALGYGAEPRRSSP